MPDFMCTGCDTLVSGEPADVGTRHPDDGVPSYVLCEPCSRLNNLYWLVRDPYWFADEKWKGKAPSTSIIDFLRRVGKGEYDERLIRQRATGIAHELYRATKKTVDA